MAQQMKFIDADPYTPERNSSLRNENKAITTKNRDAQDAFNKGYSPFDAPNKESEARKNYRTYPYDYFCVDGDEQILVYRNNQYEVISIKEFNHKTDKILSKSSSGSTILTSALLYSYDYYDYLNLVWSNGESHLITNNHKYINESNGFNFNGKIPELGDEIHQIDDRFLPNSRPYNYIDCRNICSKIPNFNDNNNGTFTIKGKGTKKSNWYKIPNTVFLDENLAYVFGLYVSKGHIIDDKNRLTGRGYGVFFTLNINEKDIAENIVKIIKDKFNIDGKIKEYPEYSRLSIMFLNKALTYIFRAIDFGLTCNTKKVPDIIFKTQNADILKSFLAGCFIGNGTCCQYYISYKSTSKKLIYGIKLLLRLLNIDSNIHISQKETKQHRESYNLCIYSDNKLNLISAFKKFNWKHLSKLENSLIHTVKYTKDKIFNKVSKIEINKCKTKKIYDLHTLNGNYLLGTIWSHNSGIDAKVFFGDVWVDDIITIQYTVTQNKTPIYGYASQLYDAVARGTVIVQGTLTIAFKEMGYLNLVQRIVENQSQSAKAAIEKKVNKYAEQASSKKLRFIPNIEGTPDRTGATIGLAGVGFSPNGTAQIIRQSETIEDILKQKKGGNVVSSGLSTILLDQEKTSGDRDFEDFAEILEDTIWGDSNGRPLGKTLKYRRADEFDYTYTRTGEDEGGVFVGRDDYANCLNIMITFGDMNDYRAEHTLMVLNDVHFTSQGVLLSPTGEPIGETYSFFARDINQTIVNSSIRVNRIKFDIGGPAPSTLSDIDELQKYMEYKDGFSVFNVYVVASFKDEEGWSTPKRTLVAQLRNFGINKYEPLIDQLIKITENAINDPTYSQLDPSYVQHIVEVEMIGRLDDEGKAMPGRLQARYENGLIQDVDINTSAITETFA